jgi:hypothetical protein
VEGNGSCVCHSWYTLANSNILPLSSSVGFAMICFQLPSDRFISCEEDCGGWFIIRDFFAFSVRVFVVEFISPSPLPVLPPLLATTNRRRLLLSYLCGGGIPHLWILGKQYVDWKKCQEVGNHTGATNVDSG